MDGHGVAPCDVLGCYGERDATAFAGRRSMGNYGKRTVNRSRKPLSGKDFSEKRNDGNDPAAQTWWPLFRGLRGRQDLRAPLYADGHADGQHAVLEHDAQSAAAAHRPPFL